ncbi:MAG: spermidine synthase, partial [Chromatiales bacterium]|nr:spermidine synthase [Chromatiales bacterium]
MIFEELGAHQTSVGWLTLRKRSELRLGGELVYEVKLGDEFLMSSLFTAGEVALAELGLGATSAGKLDVVVGGLGLGYTAATALADDRVKRLRTIDAEAAVIGWHRDALVPLGAQLRDDPRSQFVHGDFFAIARDAERGFSLDDPDARCDVLLLDVDHSPSYWLNPAHAPFYSAQGLTRMREQLEPGGVFALWSNEPVDEGFMTVLGTVFNSTDAQ